MVRRPTVLIFGAGVSEDYGFPLARELLISITDSFENGTKVGFTMTQCGFDREFIRRFGDELYFSNQPSVDAFLEQHSNEADFVRLGKAAIAASLLQEELTPSLLNRTEMRLYEHLWYHVTGPIGTYAGNQLAVITFNYDRSFEHFLRKSFVASHPKFRNQADEFERALSQIEIIHVYGSLGSLDKKSGNYLVYGGRDDPFNPKVILSASERIKLYHEAIGRDNTTARMRERITEAETICFLGFAFYPSNVRLLQFCGLGENKETKHFGSAYGMKLGEHDFIRQELGFDIRLAGEQTKSLDALREFPVLQPVREDIKP